MRIIFNNLKAGDQDKFSIFLPKFEEFYIVTSATKQGGHDFSNIARWGGHDFHRAIFVAHKYHCFLYEFSVMRQSG